MCMYIYIYIYIYIHIYIHIYIYIYNSDGVVPSAWNSLKWIKGDFGGPLKKIMGIFLLNQSIGNMVEGSLEVKLPTIWTDEKQSREEAERRERLEERSSEEKESEERRCRCAKR